MTGQGIGPNMASFVGAFVRMRHDGTMLERFEPKAREVLDKTKDFAETSVDRAKDAGSKAGRLIAENKRTAAIVAGVTAVAGAGLLWLRRRNKDRA